MIVDVQQAIWRNLEKELAGAIPATEQCPMCNGMGAITLDVPSDHALFGKSFLCICRRAVAGKGNLAKLVDDLGFVPTNVREFSLDNFQGMAYSYEAVGIALQLQERDWATWDDEEKKGLLLSGSTGTGKTTIAYCVYRVRAERGEAVAWINSTNFIKRVQATYRDGYSGPSENDIIGAVIKAQFLVIDDLGEVALGNSQASANRLEIMRQVIDGRYSRDLPTVITTNLTIEQLYAQFGSLIASRIRGLCHCLVVDGPDLRVRKQRS